MKTPFQQKTTLAKTALVLCLFCTIKANAQHFTNGIYFSTQQAIEDGNFPFTIISGSAPSYTTSTDLNIPFSKVAQSNGLTEFTTTEYIPVQAGETLYGEIWAMRPGSSTGSAGYLYFGISRYDKDKNLIAANSALDYFVASGITVAQNDTWTKYSGTTTLATSHTPYSGSDGGAVRYIKPYIIVNYNTGTIPTYWGGAMIRRVAPPGASMQPSLVSCVLVP